MADYLTNTTELTSIADAIRAKGGTSASLVYPTGFVSAIENLPSGNPNGKRVITGTFDNPFGDMDVAAFIDALYNGNASAMFRFDASALGYDIFIQPMYAVNSNTWVESTGASVTADSSMCNRAVWNLNGLEFVYVEANGTIINLAPYASMVPSTLTVYYHPMPT